VIDVSLEGSALQRIGDVFFPLTLEGVIPFLAVWEGDF
jgi:hypothetical protein